MVIGLDPVDGHNFPNLALMKIGSYHNMKGDKVSIVKSKRKYDVVYKSKVFSFTEDKAKDYYADKVIKGGTGYDMGITLDNNIYNYIPMYSVFDCQHAYGFLTRGCPNKCSWCIVPEKEGNIRPNDDIENFIGDYKSAILMDNNVLASEHGIKQIEKIVDLKIKVDFNQGLDSRLIDDSMAKLLSKVKWLSPLRLACDTESSIKPLKEAVKNLRWRNCTPSRYFVYCLIKDIPEAFERVKEIKGVGLDVFAQPFIDFKNNILPTEEQKRFARWVNMKSTFKSVWWEDYKWK